MIHNFAVHQKLLKSSLKAIVIFLRWLHFLLPIAGPKKLPLLVGMNLLSYKQLMTGRIFDQKLDHEINSRLSLCERHETIIIGFPISWCFNALSLASLAKLLSIQPMVGEWFSEFFISVIWRRRNVTSINWNADNGFLFATQKWGLDE